MLEIVIAQSKGRRNAATEAMHRDLAQRVARDRCGCGVRAVLVRGAGEHFSSGGDFAMIERMIADEATLLRVWKEASDLVYNLVNCSQAGRVRDPRHGGRRRAGRRAAGGRLGGGPEREDPRRPYAPRRRRGRPFRHHLAAAVRPRQGALLPADERAARRARRPSASASSRSASTTPRCATAALAHRREARGGQRERARASPSTRSTTGCASRARPSMPRSRSNSWASGSATRAKGSTPSAARRPPEFRR